MLTGQMQAMPALVQERFEQLTSLSSQLVGQGMYGVHSMTREQLESSDAADGGDLPAGDTADKDTREGGDSMSAAADAGQRLAERLLAAAAGAGAAQGANGSSGAHDQEGSAGQQPARAAAVDAEQDIFAEDGPPDVASQADPSQAAAAEQLQQQQGLAAGGEPDSQPSATGGAGLEGFELDAASGMLYNSALGMYFDAGRRLFGDAATGQWYRLDERTKQYELVE
jgi:CD2 antigen cytoplasmic tail-binding protein 2